MDIEPIRDGRKLLVRFGVPPGGFSGAPILFLRSAGERHAVPGPLGNAEESVPAFRHLLEKLGRRPLDELYEETVRERADDLPRQLVHAVRCDRSLVRGSMAADAHG